LIVLFLGKRNEARLICGKKGRGTRGRRGAREGGQAVGREGVEVGVVALLGILAAYKQLAFRLDD